LVISFLFITFGVGCPGNRKTEADAAAETASVKENVKYWKRLAYFK
jgi:hypothetical protein